MAKAANTAKVSKSKAPAIHIGISDKDRAAIAGGLAHLLADTYTLYLTTHNFHWNVTGPMFNSLHAMFMAQYTELWNAVDPFASSSSCTHHASRLRIRSLKKGTAWLTRRIPPPADPGSFRLPAWTCLRMNGRRSGRYAPRNGRP